MEKLQEIREKASTSFWFLPSILVALSITLGFILLSVDQTLELEGDGVTLGFFRGTAAAARVLLSTIGTSLITVISIAFSVTIVALQQASTQYSPRVLRNFTRDKGNQIVLGTYLATFTYALLILRSIRDETDQAAAFVPALSITFGLVLTLICVGLLIYFISHIATSLQVENIVKTIHTALVDTIDNLFPEHTDKAVDVDVSGEELFDRLRGLGRVQHVKAKESGFVYSIDENSLSKLKTERIKLVLVMPQVGDFIAKDQVILKVNENETGEEYDPDALIDAIILDSQRSVEQDPLFAVNQLVDVALRALSTGLNDPITAQYCLFQLSDALCRLASRQFPPSKRTYEDSPVTFILNSPRWPKFVDTAFSQIRRAARSNVHVTGTLIQQLHKLAPCLPKGNRSAPLKEQLREIRASIERQSFSKRDTDALLRQINEAEKALG